MRLVAINILVFAALVGFVEGAAWLILQAGHSRVLLNPDYQTEPSAGPRALARPTSFNEDWARVNTNDFPVAQDRSLLNGDEKWNDLFEWMPNGAMTIKPNRVTRSRLKLHDGTLIYDVSLSTDALGHRTTVSAAGDQARHLIFFGCSFTWGEGVADQETLPSQTARRMPGYRGYNLGGPGAGPADMLWRTRSLGALKHVVETEGIAIFTLISDHVARTISSYSVVGVWGPHMIEAVDEGGWIRAERSHKFESPLRTLFATIVMKSNAGKLVGFNWPPTVERAHFELTARTIAELRAEYLKVFPKGRFYVLAFPLETHLTESVLPELDKLGVPYFDYTGFQLWQYTNKPIVFPHDGHPTAEAYRMTGEQLARDLRNDQTSAVAHRSER